MSLNLLPGGVSRHDLWRFQERFPRAAGSGGGTEYLAILRLAKLPAQRVYRHDPCSSKLKATRTGPRALELLGGRHVIIHALLWQSVQSVMLSHQVLQLPKFFPDPRDCSARVQRILRLLCDAGPQELRKSAPGGSRAGSRPLCPLRNPTRSRRIASPLLHSHGRSCSGSPGLGIHADPLARISRQLSGPWQT